MYEVKRREQGLQIVHVMMDVVGAAELAGLQTAKERQTVDAI